MTIKKIATISWWIAFLSLFIGIGVGWSLQKQFLSQHRSLDTVLSGGVINMPALDANNQKEFFMSQIISPAGYYGTSQDMLTFYGTMGGMAPPRLILMKGYQVLGEPHYYKQVTDNPTNSCIVIWATQGFPTIQDWDYSITQFKGTLTDKETVVLGKRKADVYLVQRKTGNVYVAFLPIHDSAGTTYYFNTCNTENKKDFIDVIESLKFRADLNLQ